MVTSRPKQLVTFISRCPPYGSNRPHLCLDMALAAAVFELDINYVFIGDGVLQLLSRQNAEQINSKALGSAMETLDLYGIEKVFVEQQALEDNGLSVDDLVVPARSISKTELGKLIRQSDTVFNL